MTVRHLCSFLLLVAALAVSKQSFAATIYAEDFTTDPTANWTVKNGPGNATTDFFYDYSLIGVPSAPSGIGTRGLKLAANNVAPALFTGVTVSPNGQNFTGNYTLSFDMWQNYAGPLGVGGSGTTQFSQYGIGTSGALTQWIGSASKDSVSFGTTLDGGSASDIRAYSSVANTSYAAGNPVYSSPGGTINNSDAYYTAAYPAVAGAPAAQLILFPGQTGATDAGETSFKWRRVKIDVAGGFATWSIDGTPMAKVDLSTVTLGGGNIFFGHSDTNSGISTDAKREALNVTLIDNVTVEIPEPATAVLCLLAAIGFCGMRRRS